MRFATDGSMALESQTAAPSIAWERVRKFWWLGHYEDAKDGLKLGIGWRLEHTGVPF